MELKHLTEEVLNLPVSSWNKIQEDRALVNRWQELGMHKNDIKGLRQQVMWMPKSYMTLHLQALEEDEELEWVPTILHPNDVSEGRREYLGTNYKYL